MASIRIDIVDLKRYFGDVKAVDGLSFSFKGGEVHGFIGPNGAGKTTTMRIMATLEVPDAGDVLFDGISVSLYPDLIRPRLGFMPDYLEVWAEMVVFEYLDFYARAYRLEPGRREARIQDVVAFAGVESLLDRPLERLSKGEKQRLSLARVLLHDPELLILDEPAAGLDPRARVELRNLLRMLAGKGKAILISSHILTELEEMCDGVTIIEQGRLRATDSVAGLSARVERGGRVKVFLVERGTLGELERFLSEQPGVSDVRPEGAGLSFAMTGEASSRAVLLKALVREGFDVSDFGAEATDLEEAFLRLTS